MQKIAFSDEQLKVWVHAPAVKDQANAAVKRLIAESLNVPVSTISIVRGSTGRQKLVEVEGLSTEEIGERLNSCVDSR